MQMVCHGLGTGALFMLAGALDERLHTRDMRQMGGLWTGFRAWAPRRCFLPLHRWACPALGNFVGEFLVLLGSFRVNAAITIVATVGLVGATIYSLWMIQQTFHGAARRVWKLADLTIREMAALAVLIAALGLAGPISAAGVQPGRRPQLNRLQRVAGHGNKSVGTWLP